MTRLPGIHVEFVKLAIYLCYILSVFASVYALLCKSFLSIWAPVPVLELAGVVGRVGRPGAAFLSPPSVHCRRGSCSQRGGGCGKMAGLEKCLRGAWAPITEKLRTSRTNGGLTRLCTSQPQCVDACKVGVYAAITGMRATPYYTCATVQLNDFYKLLLFLRLYSTKYSEFIIAKVWNCLHWIPISLQIYARQNSDVNFSWNSKSQDLSSI